MPNRPDTPSQGVTGLFSRSESAQFLATASFCLLPLVVWAIWDTRPPDDHDLSYTGTAFALLARWESANLIEKVTLLVQNFLFAGSHPQSVQTVLFFQLLLFGTTRLVYRLAALPFLFLLLAGSYLSGRRLLGHRQGLIVMFLVSTTPSILELSRNWHLHFYAAGFSACSLALALGLAMKPGGRRALWILLGVLSGLRLYTHHVALPDIAVTYLALGFLLVVAHRGADRLSHFAHGCLSLGCTAVVGSWALGFWSRLWAPPLWVVPRYISSRSEMVVPDSERLESIAGLQSLPERLSLNVGEEYLALLLIPGFLVLLPALRAATGEHKRGLRFTSLLLLAQMPIAILAVSQGSFIVDWIALLLPAVLLAVAALEFWLFPLLPRLKNVWVIVILGMGLTTAWLPLGLSILGPDPIQDPAVYERSSWRARLLVSEGGGIMRTHDTVSRSAGGISELPQTIRRASRQHPASSPAELGTWALKRLTTQTVDNSALVPKDGKCTWVEGRLPQLDREGLHGTFALSGFPAGVQLTSAAETRFVLVALVDHSVKVPGALGSWVPQGGASPSCLEQAMGQVEATFGGSARLLKDPAMVLLGSPNIPTPRVDFVLLDRTSIAQPE